jgi:deoxyribonuclease-4
MMRIGAHMSVAGGVCKAVDRAVVHGCEALQIFTKNANQWRGKPLDPPRSHCFGSVSSKRASRPWCRTPVI